MAAQASRDTGTPTARGRALGRGRRPADAAPRHGAVAAAPAARRAAVVPAAPARWAAVALAAVLVAGAGAHDAAADPSDAGRDRAPVAVSAQRSPSGAHVADAPRQQRPADVGGAVEARPVTTEVDPPPPPAPTEDAAARTARLAALEAAVVAAETAAADLASAQVLTPRPATARTPDGDQRFTRVHTPGGAAARLHPDAPPAVVALVRAYPNGAIPTEALCPVPFARSALLQCDAADALVLLDAAYHKQFGTHLDVTSAYRTFESQVGLRASKGGLAAVPGTSNHGWGLAVDLGGIGGLGEFDSLKYLWLKAHAERFGWHHPRVMEPGGGGPQEPWHWEFATA